MLLVAPRGLLGLSQRRWDYSRLRWWRAGGLLPPVTPCTTCWRRDLRAHNSGGRMPLSSLADLLLPARLLRLSLSRRHTAAGLPGCPHQRWSLCSSVYLDVTLEEAWWAQGSNLVSSEDRAPLGGRSASLRLLQALVDTNDVLLDKQHLQVVTPVYDLVAQAS